LRALIAEATSAEEFIRDVVGGEPIDH
jgi:hypothetical protein